MTDRSLIDAAPAPAEPRPAEPTARAPALPRKWTDAKLCADGAARAEVALRAAGVETLWFNTGTLCNIACANCYIESSPTNDRLVYLNAEEARRYLDEIDSLGWDTREIGFTGGEPFLNPDAPEMIGDALERGREALVLTNAMRPMLRERPAAALKALAARHGARLTLRVSLDHHAPEVHDAERGAGAFAAAMEGLRFLAGIGARLHVAGRAGFAEDEAAARAGYAALFHREGLPIDADDPVATLLFPEMRPEADPPEITQGCWSILNRPPESVMCANARMVVKRRGAARPAVLACTLIPYDARFELGETLAESSRPVALQHPYCATFCVLGGARCSA
ncbi:MAG: radical SAM protein [Pseudomonadota bacterium]